MSNRTSPSISPAHRRAVEALEPRRLLAFNGPNFELPFVHDFHEVLPGAADSQAIMTGFPIIQGNTAGDEYQPDLLQLDLESGHLLITSRGSNLGDRNNLANGLQVPFDASSGQWLAHTRITNFNAPLTSFNAPFQEAGLLVGPTQDNYVKLVFTHDEIGRVVQFFAETTDTEGTRTFPLGSQGVKSVPDDQTGVDLSTAGWIDLWLHGDPSTGVISAQYEVEGGPRVRFEETLDLTGNERASFFRPQGARAGLMAAHHGDASPITAAFDRFELRRGVLPGTGPSVSEVRPGQGATEVARDRFVAVDLFLPDAGIDGATLEGNVRLIRVADGLQVPATVNTTGGGDAIILTPNRALDANTLYRFEVDEEVTDLTGEPLEPFQSTFTTGWQIEQPAGAVAFDQITLPQTAGNHWTSVNIGPDGWLYATSIEGLIRRWEIAGDGTLGTQQTITTIQTVEGDQRIITGLAFDPAATADNPVVYVTHTQFTTVTTFSPGEEGEDFTGKLTRLSGPNLEEAQDLVVGLPRSTRDHLTNQPSFGPDGRIYIPQGSNSAMGAPDSAWGNRPERLLSAAVLAVDLDLIADEPVNVNTTGDDPYDPFAAGAPVTIFATGLRNAYDLVWHSNGHLYVPTNGSAAGGNTPASPDGDVPGLTNVPQTQSDYLFRVEEGGYYGHPNPERGEYVLNGGNPTAGVDPAEVPAYPVGTQPDPNWRGFAWDFGLNQSANGVIEYQADSFGGALNGALVVARYSGGDDLIVLDLDANGQVIGERVGIIGFTGFNDPLDIAQRADGALYVSEFGGQQITLLRPVEAGGQAEVVSRRVYMTTLVEDAGSPSGAIRDFAVRNTGSTTLLLNSYTLTITGPDYLNFRFVDPPDMPVALEPGESHSFPVEFLAPADAMAGEIYESVVAVRTNDPNAPEIGTRFRALITPGQFGTDEPSLQQLVDLWEFNIDAGADLITAPLFQPLDATRPVTAVPLGAFGTDNTPFARFGIHEPGRPQNRLELQEIHGNQTIDPEFAGAVKFTPDGTFGLWMESLFPFFRDDLGRSRIIYSEPQLNLWEPQSANRDKVAVYPIQDAAGNPVTGMYLAAFEDAAGANTDFNDLIVVLRNVEPVTDSAGRLAVVNPFHNPFSDRLVFNTIDPDFRDHGSVPDGEQMVREVHPVTFRNVGAAPVQVTSATASGEFDVVGFSPLTLEVGQQTTFDVHFVADDGSTSDPSENLHGGLLTVQTDAGQTVEVELAGIWQPWSEDDWRRSGVAKGNMEPRLHDLMWLFGWDINTGTPEQLANDGVFEAVGDEVLSPYWRPISGDVPIEVYQIAAFHNLEIADALAWFPEGNPGAENVILRHEQAWAQSVLPNLEFGDSAAAATFSPGANTIFGFRVDDLYSDPQFNTSPFNPADEGHYFRFFPVRDRAGNLMQDTWLLAQDFAGFDYDYNDNVYLIRGMRPAELGDRPGAVGGFRGETANVINWGHPSPQTAAGEMHFAVYRSIGGRDNFTKLHAGSITDTFFEDGGASAQDGVVYYRVFALDGEGVEGMFSDVRIG